MIFDFMTFVGSAAFLIGRGAKESKQNRQHACKTIVEKQAMQTYFDKVFYEELNEEMFDRSRFDELWCKIEQYKRNRGWFYLCYSKHLMQNMDDFCKWRVLVGHERIHFLAYGSIQPNKISQDLLMMSYDKATESFVKDLVRYSDRKVRQLYKVDSDNKLKFNPEQAALILETIFIKNARGEDHDAIVAFIGGYEFNPSIEDHRKHVVKIIARNIKSLLAQKSWYDDVSDELRGPLYKASTMQEYDQFLHDTGASDDPIIRQNIIDREERYKQRIRHLEKTKPWIRRFPEQYPTYVPESHDLDELLCCILRTPRFE